jgi:7-cyano-7-deazaguanine synthase in queuosine biosynthesis
MTDFNFEDVLDLELGEPNIFEEEISGLVSKLDSKLEKDCSSSRIEALRNTINSLNEKKCYFIQTPKGQMREKLITSLLLRERTKTDTNGPKVFAFLAHFKQKYDFN